MKKQYRIINVGKGILKITIENLHEVIIPHNVLELGSTQIIDLGYTNIEIVDHINQQMPNILIQEQSDGYVIVKGIIMGDFREFLWIGIGGNYGREGLQCSYYDLKEFANINQFATKSELASKANNNNVVHLVGDETIKGVKTFVNDEFATQSAVVIENKTYDSNGSWITNFFSGIGQYIWNKSYGIGLFIKNSSTGIALLAEIEGSGDGIVSNATNTATGKLYVGKNEAIETFSVDKLGVISGTKIINRTAPPAHLLLADGKTIAQTALPGPDLSSFYSKTEVDAKLSSVYKFMGNVANYGALPSSGRVLGHVYNLLDTGANYAWTGSDWDKLGDTIDLTRYIPYTGATSFLNLGDFPIFARYFISRGRFLATEIGVGSDAFSAESSDGKYFGIMRNNDNTGTLVLYNSLGTETRISLNGMNGTVAANSFVKKDGTSKQFLKADGSVDESDIVKNIFQNGIQGANITGTVSETILYSQKIPANSFKNGDIFTLYNRIAKVGPVATLQHRVKINTLNTLTGATLIASNSLGFANKFGNISRNYILDNGFLSGFSFGTLSTNDTFNSNLEAELTSFNPKVDNYIFITGQLSNGADAMYSSAFKITN